VLAALHEYVAFVLLLFALFTITGGIHLRGTLAGMPIVNTMLLAIGGGIASFVGTTGASMLLIRPLLRANALRRRKVHVVVFFIFIVANCGGLLTPLGDPPLFLGFLRGVPFGWTFGLWRQWLVVNVALLVIFMFLDNWHFHREDVLDRRDLDEDLEAARTRLGIEGGFNFVLLAGVIAAIWASGRFDWPLGVREGTTLALGVASIALTKKTIRERNQFSWHPIVEVAVLFLGIFLAMMPALLILNARGAELGVDTPREYFWATGMLSSFLDNAPTYLTFASVAAGSHGIQVDGRYLEEYLKLGPDAALVLAAVSCGAVFMGANTYIGNGPNFMVKAIAERSGVKMPGFFGYMAWSLFVLVPLFGAVTLYLF